MLRQASARSWRASIPTRCSGDDAKEERGVVVRLGGTRCFASGASLECSAGEQVSSGFEIQKSSPLFFEFRPHGLEAKTLHVETRRCTLDVYLAEGRSTTGNFGVT